MRATTLLNTVLGIKFTVVKAVEFTETGLVCDVEPTTSIPRCGGCLCRVRKVHDRRKPRLWRHLDLAGMTLALRYAPRRVRCPRCGVTTELVPACVRADSRLPGQGGLQDRRLDDDACRVANGRRDRAPRGRPPSSRRSPRRTHAHRRR